MKKRMAEEKEEAVSKTAAAIQSDQLDKMSALLDRIHRRVA
jgi:hypothetical protein